jgi:uncharacterized repeat protein (TIGR03943 family)
MRNAGAAILVVAGGVVLQLTLFGEFQNYVKAGHRPWLLAVGAGMVLLGIAGLVHEVHNPGAAKAATGSRAVVRTHGPFRTEVRVGDDAQHSDEAHDHTQVPGVAWLLCVPVFLVLLVPPPALGAFTASRSGATVPQPSAAHFDALPPGDPVELQVHDYAERAVWDRGRTLTGRTVVLTGFVTPKQEGAWYLTRVRIACCAADSKSYLIEVLDTSRDYPANTWLHVTGRFAPSTTSDPHLATARLDVVNVLPTEQPEAPYEQ